MKKAFTLVEIFVVIFLALIVSSIVIPMVVQDSKRAQEISTWRRAYSDVTYTFDSLGALYKTNDDSRHFIENKLKKAKNNTQKEDFLIEEFAPYFRVISKFEDKNYKIKYLNGSKVNEKDYYYFSNFYKTQSEEIIGVKWLGEIYGDESPFALLLFDVNGVKAPNKWGKDVFGITLSRVSVEPLGKGIAVPEIKLDCSNKGSGVYCSYEFLIGAQF